MAGTVLGVVGFFMISVVGGFLGFVLGIHPAERITLGTHAGAWSSTNHALNAIRLSMGMELLTGLAIVTTWLVGATTPPRARYCPSSRRRSQRCSRRRKKVCLVALDFLLLRSLPTRPAGWRVGTDPSSATAPSVTLGTLGGLIA